MSLVFRGEGMGEIVVIRDVTLRDGLQNIYDFISTEDKIELFHRLVQSGLKHLEITSFVNPKAVPQFQDAPQVAKAILKIKPEEVEVSALVPNLKGAELALQSGIRHLGLVISVSESHNISNVRRTTAESIAELKRILELKANFPDLQIKVGMATVFGCPFEGKIPAQVTLNFVRQFYELGIREMSLADTVGFGNPKEVRETCRLCLREFPEVAFSVHLHNTRGLGLANSLAAYEAGIHIHDGAIGGLGGCPFAPGAKGNTATEDLVFMFEEMGVSTGIKISSLIDACRYLQGGKKNITWASSILEVGVPAPRGPITKEGFEQKWSI